MGTFPHSDQGLVHVRIGDSSGRWNHGSARTAGSVGGIERCKLRAPLCVPLCPLWLMTFLTTEGTEAHRGRNRGMANSRDIVIIGGGHNGLVTAFYLAKAGFKPLVLERRNQVGGAAITDEFHPGFRSSVLAHSAGPLRPEVVRDMQLE